LLQLPERLKTKTKLTHRSDEAMICIGNFKKSLHIFVEKAQNFAIFPFTYVSKDKALNALSLQFLRSIKCFIATIFYSA
jgi:hypothetical protein